MKFSLNRSLLLTILHILIFLFSGSIPNSFKGEQLKFPRVRKAYSDAELPVLELLDQKSIEAQNLELYIRVFKQEQELELWGKNSSDSGFQLIQIYSICQSSGVLGPKRRQGDLQVPEGFYHINIFNPYSNFYLSLGINYPNASDRILGEKDKLGGNIFIHGSCVTIGCIPITDPKIKELYLLCVEARNNGQTKIPVTIFPMRLADSNFTRLCGRYSSDKDKVGLWSDLKEAFSLFNSSHQLPEIQFLSNGRHNIW